MGDGAERRTTLPLDLERVTTILEQLPSGVMLAEAPSGRVLWANAAAERIFGGPVTPTERAGDYDASFRAWDGDGRPLSSERFPLVRALRGETVDGELVTFQRPDGALRAVRANAAPVRDDDGRVVAAVTAYYDVTEAKRAQDDLALLVATSDLLAATLDYERTLEAVVALPVGKRADLCFVDLFEPDGAFTRVAVGYSDAADADLAARLRRRYPARPDATLGVARARHGETTLSTDLGRADLAAIARDDVHLALLRELAMRSTVTAPLVARGQAIGALTLMSRQRDYDDTDRRLATELARRAAAAIDNARLHAELESRARALVRWEQLVRYAGFGVALIGPDLRLQLVNPAYAAMHGYTVEELHDAPLSTVLSAESRDELTARGGRAGAGEHLQFESLHRKKDGSTFPTLNDVVGVHDAAGNVAYYATNCQDITARKRTEEAMRTSEARLNAFIDSSSSVAYLKDLDGRHLLVNREYERITGVGRDQLVGKTDDELIDAATAARFRADDRRVLDSGEPMQIEHTVAHGGKSRVYLTTKFPVRDAHGRVYGVGGISTDVTEHRRLEAERVRLYERAEAARVEAEAARVEAEAARLEAEAARVEAEASARRFQFLADADALLADTRDYRAALAAVAELAVPLLGDLCFFDVERVGDGALERIAWKHVDPARQAAFAGGNVRSLAAADAHGAHPVARVFGDGAPLVVERVDDEWLRSFAADDEHFAWLRGMELHALAAVPLNARARRIGALTFALHDPTRRFSRADLDTITSLGERVATAIDNARLYAEAEAARTEAERAARAKDEFLAMLGHELRNPLAPIVTALSMWKLRGQEMTREQEVIERQLQHVLRLVDDLLDVSRITRGKIELKRHPVELGRVVAQAVEIASPLLEERRHRLTVDVAERGLGVDGDETRLAQIVANLLTNAAKYTPPGGQVAVRARRDGDAVELSVSDDGIGISPELLPRLFDLFVQGERGPDRAEGGLGLGLALVRSLAEAHGGEVRARSPGRGRGSEFVLRLPAVEGAEVATIAAPVEAAPATTARRVLVVDDNEDAGEMLAELLRWHGHEVVVAYDGPGALARVTGGFVPDVAILDIGLPVMDGYELAARLREALGGETMLVALTGYGQKHDRARSRRAGFLHHIVKPVVPERLLALLAGEPGR